MSKLTNWLDDDSIDVQGIVDKYEKELQNDLLNNKQNVNQTEEIWCGKLDEYEKTKHLQPTNETINKINSMPPPPIFKQQVDKIDTSKHTINFNVHDVDQKPISNKQENNTINFDQLLKQETKLFNPTTFKTDELNSSIDQNEVVKIKNAEKSTKILNTQNDINRPNKHQTISFKNATSDLAEKNENDIQKMKTIQFVQNTVDLKETTKPPKSYFNQNFNDSFDTNDCKTERFQPQVRIKDESVKCDQVQQTEEKMNRFDEKLTNIFFNETVKAEDLDITKQINHADAFQIKQETNQKKRKVSLFSKNEEKVKQKIDLPKFIKFENFFLIINIVVSSIFFAGTLGVLGYILYLILANNESYFLLIPASLLSLIGLTWNTITIYRYRCLKKELKRSDYQINPDNPLISLKKIYKRIIVSNINLNWASALIYTVSGLTILLCFIVVYFMNLINYQINDFGALTLGQDITPSVIVWSLAGICFALIPIQIIFNILNKRRMDNMEFYYQKEIINEQAVIEYKKQARKRWKIIYASIVFVIGIIILVTYLVLRRKAKK